MENIQFSALNEKRCQRTLKDSYCNNTKHSSRLFVGLNIIFLNFTLLYLDFINNLNKLNRVWNSTYMLCPSARMAALKKTLKLINLKTRASRVIQKQARKFLKKIQIMIFKKFM